MHKVVKYLLMNSTVTVFTIVKLQLDTLVSLRVSKSLHLLTISHTLSLKNYILLSLILVPLRMKQHVMSLLRVLPLTCSTRTFKKKLLRVKSIAILIDGTTDRERPLLNSIKTIQRTKFSLNTYWIDHGYESH